MSAKRSDRDKSSPLVCLDPDEVFPLHWEEDPALDVSSAFNGLYQSGTFASLYDEVYGSNQDSSLNWQSAGLTLGSAEAESLFTKLYQTVVASQQPSDTEDDS